MRKWSKAEYPAEDPWFFGGLVLLGSPALVLYAFLQGLWWGLFALAMWSVGGLGLLWHLGQEPEGWKIWQ